MRKRLLLFLIICFCSLSFVACSSEKNQDEKKISKDSENSVELNISAAASLKDAMTQIAENYEKLNSSKIVLNFASSGKLVKQIEQGAPCDIFISASKKKMDLLLEKNIVKEESASDLLKNQLIMIAPKDSKETIEKVEDLINVDGKIALGQPDSVPAGQYAKESLENLGLWDKLQDKIVFAKDVRATLAYVEQAEVVAGFVYKSDFSIAKNSKIIQEIPEQMHKPIVYPVATIETSKNKEETKKFEEFLRNKESQEVFEKFGFKVIE